MKSVTVKYLSLLVPLGAWALMTQAGQVLPNLDCGQQFSWTLATCVAAVIVALVAIAAGLMACRAATGYKRSVGYLCIAAGLLFTFALAMQAAASMMVNPCDR